MTINWYPGHMVKARREIQENIKLVDAVAMLVDARAPVSCLNPDLEQLAQKRPVVYVLNKADLAEEAAMNAVLRQWKAEGRLAVAADSLNGRGMADVLNVFRAAFEPTKADLLRRGRRVRPMRVMVVGVPNVGKSTFLNRLVGQKIAVTGAKPGVTRGRQWVRLREDIELMDTPGLMWPKVDSDEQGLKLALLDIVGENSYEEYKVALYLLNLLRTKHPGVFLRRFQLRELPESDEELLQAIGRRLGHLIKGGAVEVEKTAKVLLLDFRRGKMGRFSLDSPEATDAQEDVNG
ncbi:MAG: ribosome biogenesis GTPase YlqF [Syntrophomonadaceae bacterium]|nr:ribosome biogenesis GTPase YlqF [Syntrophomonadaceae bacterium]